MAFRRGRHPLKIGRVGKIYNPTDYVTPICDSLDDLYNRTGTLRSWSMVASNDRDREAAARAPTPKAAPVAQVKAAKVAAGTSCKECGRTDGFFVDNENFLVCSCGVVQGRAGYKDDFKEAIDPNSRRGDAGSSQSASVMGLPGNMQKAGWIAARSKDVDADALPEQLETRIADAVVAAEENASKIAPFDPLVLADVRRGIDRVVKSSWNHSKLCGKGCGNVIHDRSALLISVKVLELVVGHAALEPPAGVSAASMRALQTRLSQLPIISNSRSTTGHAAASAIVELHLTSDERLCHPCRSPGKRRADDPKPAELKRCNSSSNELHISSLATRVRDAIDSLPDFDEEAKNTAVRVLANSNSFVDDLRAGRVLDSGTTELQMAKLLLVAVLDKEGRKPPVEVDATELQKMKAALPEIVRSVEEDELF